MPAKKPVTAGKTKAGKPAAKSPAKSKDPASQLKEYRRKRDFTRTAEPEGGEALVAQNLAFVIQKHAASHLHFDFRLELDGVMKSWAVPKGPSLDPSIKRLAMEVEDHPIEYNTFEGTIPKGQYGGGTVMLWDQGIYSYGDVDAEPLSGLRRGYAKGDLKIVLLGERLKGSWVLVRTQRGERGKPQWLLIKHRDEYAEPGSDVVSDFTTSVTTGRTMDQIARGESAVWNSNRGTPQTRLEKAVAASKPASKSRASK